MAQSWQDLEARVRATAAIIWSAPCNAGRLSGVNVDAIVELGPDAKIFIEVTERDKLNKVREDIVKIATARLPLIGRGVSVRSYIVIDGSITQGMRDAATDNNVNILSVSDFEKLFFDFQSYKYVRERSAFGSVVNPLSGDADQSQYVPVTYIVEGSSRALSIKDIADELSKGKNIVLVGEYGSGKSRCLKELFLFLSSRAVDNQEYPIAVNLRDCWGLKRAGEIVRRHFTELGLESLQGSAIRAALSGSVVYLLDGFDELGSQSWATDDRRLKAIRTLSMEAVADLASKSRAGVIVSGREHYFSSEEEMIEALGVDRKRLLIVRAKSEFTEEEMERYFIERGMDPEVPNWMPRRPLICQTVINLTDEQIQSMFGVEGDEAAFWDHFIRVIASRDAQINARFDPEVVYQVMVALSRLTRTKPANVGPISLEDMQQAFESSVGRAPVEDASVLLQRLPALGRIGADSADRQFIDIAILDTLRARDVAQITRANVDTFSAVAAEKWINPLGDLGQRILTLSPATSRAEIERALTNLAERPNKILAADLAGSLTRGMGALQDFHGAQISGGTFSVLDLSEREVRNVAVSEGIIHELRLPSAKLTNIELSGCLVGRVRGASAIGGLPPWVKGCEVDHFDSAQNVAAIRRIGLSPEHEVLVSIIKKTFFQPGAGRQEDALLRGLSMITRQSRVRAVLNVLLREGILTRFKGKEGWVYAPERSHAGRMTKIRDELSRSDDPLWDEIGSL